MSTTPLVISNATDFTIIPFLNSFGVYSTVGKCNLYVDVSFVELVNSTAAQFSVSKASTQQYIEWVQFAVIFINITALDAINPARFNSTFDIVSNPPYGPDTYLTNLPINFGIPTYFSGANGFE
jgi:hypothetical protein